MHMRIIEKKLAGEGARLTVYLSDSSCEIPHSSNRAGVLVIPGGAYKMCSDREAEPLALAFLAKGFNAFVLRYTVDSEHEFSDSFADVNEAMRLIHLNAHEWGTDKNKIAALGCSAGGHLCAAVSTFGDIRPAATILLYPCILESTGKILAFPVPSLDEKVDKKTPPAFIAAASEDDVVPIENSLAYATALSKAKIPFEIHVFEKGYHGFSLADETVYSKTQADYCAHLRCWFDLCVSWLKKRFG